MTNIGYNISELRKLIPPGVRIIAVSKTKPAAELFEAYNSGQRLFGENRVPELISKSNILPKDIEWHFIGHLQTNKVRQLLPSVSMIQSADSFRLLQTIDKESERLNKVTDCLLQFHIAREDTKSGFNVDEASEMLSSDEFRKLVNIRLCGVMGMATYTDDSDLVRSEFRTLKGIFDTLKKQRFSDNNAFREISMGMSGDYRIAIEEGATIVRIGSLIFGERN